MELLLLLLLLLLSPAAASSSAPSDYHCDWCPRHSTASLFPSNYDSMMMELLLLPTNVHHPTAASADFLCGACYQLRCTDRRLCGDHDGVKVVVVTEKTNGTAGFLLTRDAFAVMGMPSDQHQLDGGLLDNPLQVHFRRIPCEYRNKNLAVQVELQGSSRNKPNHLAVRFLYQGGLTDIAAVEIAQQGGSSWRSMARRRKQGVWRIAHAPDGPLQLRLVVTAGSGGRWLRTALPAGWRPGGVYDTGLQVTDVAVRACRRSCRLSGDGNDEDELR